MKQLTIKQIHSDLIEKKYSVVELTKYYLDRIKKYNTEYNIYLNVTESEALTQAKITDDKIQNEQNIKLLEGIPASIKDVIITKDVKTTAGSKMLENFIPPYDSTVVNRLKEQGMVLLGKTNCDAFAFGASTENSGYGPSKNPWDKAKVPGGSSGGSAAAVSADLCSYSLGTDTGGSIRQPAAFCGNVGLKLTYGRASRYGLIAMASSFDTPGPITRTVEDAAIVASTISGFDKYDSTTYNDSVPNYADQLTKNLNGTKIAVLAESFGEGVEEPVKNNVKRSISVFEKLGAQISEVSLPKLKYGISAYYILVPSEISSNMSRFDATRFGYLSNNAQTLLERQSNSREEVLEEEVKRRIMLGNYALSSGYYDAYYLKAAKIRTLIKQEFENTLKDYDVIISPTSPTVAFNLNEKKDDPLAMYLADIFTCPVNIAGLPAISIPCGFSDSNLPVGLQIIGRSREEQTVLNVAYAYEQATPWHTKFAEVFE